MKLKTTPFTLREIYIASKLYDIPIIVNTVKVFKKDEKIVYHPMTTKGQNKKPL